jgi:peptide/nickel transport system substrate-binding protein
MDPQDAQLYSSLQVYKNIFARLIDVNADFTYHPSLATKWTQDDEKTWTVDLLDGVTFHNGEPLTASDVKFSFDRVKQHPNAVFLAAFDQTEVLAKNKVRFHMAGPYGLFEAALAGFSDIVNEKAVTSADPKLHPVGAGPYKMAEWVQNDHITLQRNEKYFKSDRPYLDKVVFRSIGDDSVRLTGLQTGELGWIQRVPPQQTSSLLSSTSIKHTEPFPFLPDFIWLNCSKPPFNDVRVRQAVAWCVNPAEIAKLVYFSQGQPATEAVSAPNSWYSGVNPYKGGPDPEKAKALLKQAGKENLHITFLGQSNLPTQIRSGEVIKSQLAKAGITMDIQPFEAAQFFDQLLNKKYDIMTGYWSVTYDPGFLYYPLLHSTSGWNFLGFSDPNVDALLNKFIFNSDQKARRLVYPDLVNAVATAAPIIFIDNEVQQYWTRNDISGVEVLPTIDIRVEDMWLKH